MAILTVRTSGLGFGPAPMGAPQPKASDLRRTPSSGGGMSKGMRIPKRIAPPGFTPRYIAPAQRTTSTFGPPKLDTPESQLLTPPPKKAVETANDFIAETEEANVGQDSTDAQDVIKTDEGGTSTDDVVTPDDGRTRVGTPMPVVCREGYRLVPGSSPPRCELIPPGMSTGKKVAIGLGVGLAAVALFSFLR